MQNLWGAGALFLNSMAYGALRVPKFGVPEEREPNTACWSSQAGTRLRPRIRIPLPPPAPLKRLKNFASALRNPRLDPDAAHVKTCVRTAAVLRAVGRCCGVRSLPGALGRKHVSATLPARRDGSRRLLSSLEAQEFGQHFTQPVPPSGVESVEIAQVFE